MQDKSSSSISVIVDTIFPTSRSACRPGSEVPNLWRRSANKHLQTENIRKLCSAPLIEAQLHCPQFVDECEALRDKFEPLFVLFGRCHSIYDQSLIDNFEELGIITGLLSGYGNT